MTSPLRIPRTLLRLAAATVTLVALAVGGAASADVPVGWSDPKPVPVLHDILVLGGIPILVILIIAAAVYLPSIVRGESVAPAGLRSEDQWFGGRDLPRGEQARAEVTSGSRESTDSDSGSGGAGGSW